MIAPVSALVENEAAAVRWQAWLARGAKADRRTAKRMRALLVLIAGGLAIAAVIALS